MIKIINKNSLNVAQQVPLGQPPDETAETLETPGQGLPDQPSADKAGDENQAEKNIPPSYGGEIDPDSILLEDLLRGLIHLDDHDVNSPLNLLDGQTPDWMNGLQDNLLPAAPAQQNQNLDTGHLPDPFVTTALRDGGAGLEPAPYSDNSSDQFTRDNLWNFLRELTKDEQHVPDQDSFVDNNVQTTVDPETKAVEESALILAGLNPTNAGQHPESYSDRRLAKTMGEGKESEPVIRDSLRNLNQEESQFVEDIADSALVLADSAPVLGGVVGVYSDRTPDRDGVSANSTVAVVPKGSEEKPAWAPTLVPIDSDNDFLMDTIPMLMQFFHPAELGGEAGEQKIELDDGPLAGMQSVLPGSVGQNFINKAGTYSTQILINETQKAQSVLFDSLIQSETAPLTIEHKTEKNIIRRIRWLIASVLFLTILFLSASESEIFPYPIGTTASGSVGTFFNTINGLPERATVVVVLDYQPGFAGELETIIDPIMGQLLGKNVRLAFISTSPLGTLLVDRIIQKASFIASYQPGIQYENLGYLAGGAGGIKAFAEQPRTTIGKNADGNLWDSPALQAVTVNSETNLSNFSAMIVATDNPDTGRLWIEQAQPLLKYAPMLMVVSAQAEPVMRPYLTSAQLKGLISGLEGGLLYEKEIGSSSTISPEMRKFISSGKARQYWDSFSAGILVAELFIIVGFIWHLVQRFKHRNSKDRLR